MTEVDRGVDACTGLDASRAGAPPAPLPEPIPIEEDASRYVTDDALDDAIQVSLLLGQPLLVTGDPGTGKTRLAYYVAWRYGIAGPHVFDTKSTSTARDLFYRYDALAQFQDAQIRRDPKPTASYIEFQALGLAILLASPESRAEADLLPEALRGVRRPARSVVLIDEIDKAPRDLPNDVLREILDMRFEVRETGREFWAEPDCRPVVVLTSNSEKNLPEAFLRRCAFHHLEFPDTRRLRDIIVRSLGRDTPAQVDAPRQGNGTDGHTTIGPTAASTVVASGVLSDLDEHAIQYFQAVRALRGLKKRPSTAEFLGWLRILRHRALDPVRDGATRGRELASTYAVLAKGREDLEEMLRFAGLTRAQG